MTKVGVYSALFGLWPILAAASTPVPTYGTYFGGTGDTNAAVAVAVDSAGNVIMAGYTTSQTLPGTAHAFQPTKATGFPDNRDVFIAKFDPTGRNLLWATFLGGDGDDIPVAVAVDSSSNIYVTGTTDSTNFPLTPHAYLTTPQFAFIAKVSADGSTLLYSTFLPFDVEPIAGRYRDNALAVNGNGEAYIAGISNNLSAFVTPGALNIAGTIFLARVNSTGSGLIFGALLGGEGFNGSAVTSLTLDASGNCYLAGVTGESNVPTTSQALEGRDPNAGLPGKGIGPLNDANSGFLLEVNSTGSQILYGTYFGLRYYETSITQISLGSSGAIYFSGST
ncbi:MAG: SBBP repeat-containing protein, partial [Bryobacteraceae bacterium]